MRDILDKNVKRLGAAGFGLLAPAVILFALFFGESFASEGAYAEIGRAVALFAILGSVASAGCLAFFVLRLHAGDPGLWTSVPSFSREPFTESGNPPGEGWPLLVTLLFGGIPVLFAGLAGWVSLRA